MNDEQVLKLYRLIKDNMDALEKRMNSRFDAVEQQIDDVRGHIDHLYGEQQTREIGSGPRRPRLRPARTRAVPAACAR